jgi:hypothetical protein
MKAFPLLFIIGLVPGLPAQDPGGQVPRTKALFRDAATHDTLVERGRSKVDPISQLPEVKAPEDAMNSKAHKPESILARSEVIRRGKVATLVPKEAILHLPAGLRGVIGLEPGVRMVPWKDFYTANRSWIRTIEVTRDQAEGFVPMPEETVASFKDSTYLIVATYQTGPISVMPVKEEAAATESEPTTNP